METTDNIKAWSADKRSKELKSAATAATNAKTKIAKVLVAAYEAGDFETGEMNSYAARVTGLELRREVQGVYEAVNVLEGIRAGQIDATEDEFDQWKDIARVALSGLLSKSPEKIPEALRIIRSGEGVTKQLKALRKPSARENPSPEKGADTPRDDAGAADATPAPAEAPAAEDPAPEGESATAVDVIEIPANLGTLSSQAVIDRLLEDIAAADEADCEVYASILGRLGEKLTERLAEIQGAAAKAA